MGPFYFERLSHKDLKIPLPSLIMTLLYRKAHRSMVATAHLLRERNQVILGQSDLQHTAHPLKTVFFRSIRPLFSYHHNPFIIKHSDREHGNPKKENRREVVRMGCVALQSCVTSFIPNVSGRYAEYQNCVRLPNFKACQSRNMNSHEMQWHCEVSVFF